MILQMVAVGRRNVDLCGFYDESQWNVAFTYLGCRLVCANDVVVLERVPSQCVETANADWRFL